MSELNTVHFSVGSRFGQLLTELAEEKAIYSFDLDGAVNIIKQSLIGLSEKDSFKVLVGIKCLSVNTKTQEVLCNLTHATPYTKFQLTKFRSKLVEVNRESKKILYYFKEEVRRSNSKHITVNIAGLTKYYTDNSDSEELLDDINSNYLDLESFILTARNFTLKEFKKIIFYKDLKSKIIELNLELPKELRDVIEIPSELIELHKYIVNLPLSKQLFDDIESDDISRYINNTIAINKVSENGLKPCNILDGYNAGYLSQEGVYYGLNGEINDLLHINLVDMMIDAGIIPKDFDGDVNGESFLERRGWIRHSDNWVLYSGYDNSKLGGIDIPISDKQIKAIYEFGQLCCKGVLKIGILQKVISAAMWQMIDPIQFKLKWFNF